ncbi:MAG: HEAT repeat domain-containing protein [bacterium]|nr:MAG: HEAT repeat domain-containing protein [bacterium]
MKTMTKLGLAVVLTVFLSSALLANPPGDKEYDQYLIKSLQDENVGVRSSAAQLLGERKVAEAVEPLMKMLKMEKNSSARIVYAVALYQIGNGKALPTLKQVATKDKNKTVRRVVSAIVYQMETVQVAQK